MEKRLPEYYETHVVILPKGFYLSKKGARDLDVTELFKMPEKIRDSLFAAIIERKNVVLKPKYQSVFIYGYISNHPTLGNTTAETSPIVGLRLEEAIEPSGKKVTHIYFRTQNREYLSYDEESLISFAGAQFKIYKDSGRRFSEFEHLFDEVNDIIPIVQMIDKKEVA